MPGSVLQPTSPNALVPTLDSILAPPEKKPKNPYLDRIMSRPRLMQGPPDGMNRSLIDRFWLDVEGGYRQTILGAGESALYENLPGQFDATNPMEVENRLRADRIKQGQREYEAMRPAKTPLEYGVAVAGHLFGAARSPETFAALPTRFVTSGATALARTFRAGVSGAAINTAIDPVVQSLRMEAGLQEHYSPAQTAAAAAIGLALPSIAQGAIEVGRAARAPLADAPEAPRLRPEATGEPRPAEPKATVDEAAGKIGEAAAALRAEAARPAPDVAPAFPPRAAEPVDHPQVATAEVIGTAELKALGDPGDGSFDMGRAGDAARARVKTALDEDRKVSIIVEGKAHRVSSVSPLGLVDENGNPWGAMIIAMPAKGDVPRIEIGGLPSEVVARDPARAIVDEAKAAVERPRPPGEMTLVEIETRVDALEDELAADPKNAALKKEMARLIDEHSIRVTQAGFGREPDARVPKPSLADIARDFDARITALKGEIDAAISDSGILVARKGDRAITVSRSNRKDGMLQITYFSKGETSGHIETPADGSQLGRDAFEISEKGWERLTGAEADAALSPETYAVESGADGLPQTVIPGAEPITGAEQAQRKADGPLRASAPQRPADEGLFGDDKLQTDLVDQLRQTERTPLKTIPDFVPEAAPATPNARAGVFLFDPRDLQVDAKQFQFKAGGDTEGVTPILRGVTRWDADAAGKVMVWQRADQKLFVADGHQRIALARRMLESGAETDISLPGSLYRESDGFSAEDVMILAALKNIKEGSGDVMDTARILRARPDAAGDIAEISRAQTRQAVALANLSDNVWRMVVNEAIEPRDAAVIGRLLRDNADMQEAAGKLLARVKPASEAEAEILVRRVRDSELVKADDGAQGSMFVDLVGPESLVAEETRIVASATKLLARDRNVMRRIVANAERIEETGSKIERAAATDAATEAQMLSRMIETLAFTKGPARDSLLELAKGLKNGSVTSSEAAESFVEAVRLATPVSGQRRAAAGGGRPSDADSGQATLGDVPRRPGKGELHVGRGNRSSTGVAAGTGPEAERLNDISERIVAALGLTVREGRITKPGARGTFNPQSGVTRIRRLGQVEAFDTLVHEGGHALHLAPTNQGEIDALIAAHSAEIERMQYTHAPAGKERVEGFAEWFRLFITNPAFAQREAPNFTADFTRWMEANRGEQFQQLIEVQNAYRDWLQAPSRDLVVGDLVTSAKPPLPPRVAKALGPDRLPTGESLFSFFDRFYTWTLDRLHPVNRAVHSLLDVHHKNTGERITLTAASDAYKLLRLATNAYQAGHMDLSYGVVPYRKLDPEGRSLAEGLELAAGKNWFGYWRSDDLLDFGGYLVARRSIVEFQRFLAGEVPNPPGKLTLGDYRQAAADLEAAHPNFSQAAEVVYQWQTNLLRKKFEAGLVSRTFYEGSLAKSDYVPFRRDFSEKVDELIQAVGTGGTNRQSVMKTYRGSLRSIINPIESMIADAYDTAAIIARNDAFRALADLARKAGQGGGAIAEIVPSHEIKSVTVDLIEALRAAGKDAGLARDDVDGLILQATEALDADDVKVTLYKAGEAPEKGEPIVYFWEGGERKALRLADRRFGRELYEALTQIGGEQSNWMIDMLAVPARALRMGITTSPEFLIANYTRDQIAAFVLNTHFVPFVSGARGAYEELTQGRAARLYAQAGGVMGGANVASLDQARIGRSITALQRKGYNVRRVADLREFLKLTEVSETGTRIALFKQYHNRARRNGLNEYEALVEGAFEARDYMDFGRHGSKMLFARRIVTFMNAALQGTDKTLRVLVGDLRPMARVFRGETLTQAEKAKLGRSVAAWTKISALTALGATYAALYRDDPEFQEASEYLRATHWLFKAPGGNWIAVPKPYEMATILNLGERAADGLMADDPTWAERWIRSWAYTLTIPLEPAGLMVPAEIAFNYDTFRDRPIVPQWDMGKEPALQFNSYTSEFSKAVGKAINVSPAKIDHLIVGWTGSWGRNILSASNAAIDPARRSAELYDWPVTGRFVKNLSRGSDATDKFYGLVSETGGRLELKNNTFKALESRGQESEAAGYYAGLRDDEKVWVALNSQEKADNKRLHPLRRASDVAGVLSGMRREILGRNVVGIVTEQTIAVNPTMAAAINDQIARASAAEVRNAMIAVGEPGWAQREIVDVTQFYDAISALSPDVAGEIEARLGKKKVLPFEGVQAVWPELRDRLLKDGTEAFVSDLRADAISAGPSRRRALPASSGDPFRGVSLRQ